MIISRIKLPLLNANEPEAKLAGIYAQDKQKVAAGTLLFTVETTKATTEIVSTASGYVHILVKEGDLLGVGDDLALVTDSPSDERKTEQIESKKPEEQLRITQPALNLARLHNVDLNILPKDRLITEDVVKSHMREIPVSLDLGAIEKPAVIIYGAGGHAKTLIEILKQKGHYHLAGILDDDDRLTGSRVFDLRVMGNRTILSGLRKAGIGKAVNGVGGILDIHIRVSVFQLLEEEGFTFPVIMHPSAVIEPSATVDEGVQVLANVYIGTDARLHPRCMVNTSAVVSHDCIIGEYSHIAPGTLLAGHVKIGEKTLIGMGVTTAIGVKIGNGVRIGNGAIILADVPDKTIIQAGRYWIGKQD
jgi:sugar O-acyltransferase (sialic acid O-acetyltransferase NeuD family)